MSEYEAIFAGGWAETYRLYEDHCSATRETINPEEPATGISPAKTQRRKESIVILTEIKKFEVLGSKFRNVEHRTNLLNARPYQIPTTGKSRVYREIARSRAATIPFAIAYRLKTTRR